MDQQIKQDAQDAQALMKVVHNGAVEDQERIRISTLSFLFGMRAATSQRKQQTT